MESFISQNQVNYSEISYGTFLFTLCTVTYSTTLAIMKYLSEIKFSGDLSCSLLPPSIVNEPEYALALAPQTQESAVSWATILAGAAVAAALSLILINARHGVGVILGVAVGV